MSKNRDIYPVTQRLAEFTANLRYEELPDDVLRQIPITLIDLFRVASVGVRMPWLVKLRDVMNRLGGRPTSAIYFCDERTDPVRAAYLNGVIAGSLDWDDTHVGAMLHPGVVVWPAALAIGEKVGAGGRELVTAVVAGYETMIRIGLSVQPGHFQRGFQSTATCGVFGAAVAAAKLLGLSTGGIRDALGIATSYSGGVTQFFLSGSEVKRLHAGKASAAGLESALFAQAGLTGPPDAIEGSQGFARAMADGFDPIAIDDGLGIRYHITGLTFKPHAGSARFQAAIEAACKLVQQGVHARDIESIEIGVPQVIIGRLTLNNPKDVQQAQMSAPFATAMTLVLAEERPPPLVLTFDDFHDCLEDKLVRELAGRTNCVVDPLIEEATTPEYVPARVTVHLQDGRTVEERVMQPTGCPDRPMTIDDISTRFMAVTGPLLEPNAAERWLALARAPEHAAQVGELMTLRLRN
jgi:2-methylcitrate dehydratase PrpD